MYHYRKIRFCQLFTPYSFSHKNNNYSKAIINKKQPYILYSFYDIAVEGGFNEDLFLKYHKSFIVIVIIIDRTLTQLHQSASQLWLIFGNSNNYFSDPKYDLIYISFILNQINHEKTKVYSNREWFGCGNQSWTFMKLWNYYCITEDRTSWLFYIGYHEMKKKKLRGCQLFT